MERYDQARQKLMTHDLETDLPPPRKPARWAWVAVLLAGGLLALLVLASKSEPGNRGAAFPGVGVELSVLRFAPLTGEPPPVEKEDLRGKVTVINFWGPWCYFCREEMPYLLDLRQQFAGRDDFRLLLVSYSGGAGSDVAALKQDTAEFLGQFPTPPPSYHDPYSRSLAALAREAKLPNVGFPMTAVLDRQGVLRGLWIGFLPGDAEAMEDLVAKLLKS